MYLPNFIQIKALGAVMTLYRFLRICTTVLLGHPRSRVDGPKKHLLGVFVATVLLGHPRSRVDGPKKHLRGVFVVNLHSRFEVCSFSHSTDTEGSLSSKDRTRDIFSTVFDVILHFFR